MIHRDVCVRAKNRNSHVRRSTESGYFICTDVECAKRSGTAIKPFEFAPFKKSSSSYETAFYEFPRWAADSIFSTEEAVLLIDHNIRCNKMPPSPMASVTRPII